jgi:two-component system, OmpR family, sensor kinase
VRVTRPTSLRLRLTVFVAVALLTSAALAFVVVYISTGSQLRGQTDNDLIGDVTQLVQALRGDQSVAVSQAHQAVARYVGAQPYSATSTLLFVGIPGTSPISSEPAAAGTPGVPSAVERWVSQLLRDPHAGYFSRRMPGVGMVRVLERRVVLARSPSVVGVAEPLTSVARAQRGVARAFVLAAALALLLTVIAAYFAGARVTAPLRRMAAVAARVDAGDLEPRMADASSHGAEVRVLADAFNHMLDRLAVAFSGQRAFIADASHELRTPLTVIRGQLEVLASLDDPPADEIRRVERVVQAEVSRMSRLVDDLMLLTAAEQHGFLRPEPLDLPEFVSELWDGLSLTADRHFELGPIPAGTLIADGDRLAQALRNLGRNAIAQTAAGSGLVRLEALVLDDGRLRFAVIDDGPGIPSGERERVFERLYRLDAARSRADGGSGLGLAIVRAIAEAHGGEVRAAEPDGGRGARIELTLGRFTPPAGSPSSEHAVGQSIRR